MRHIIFARLARVSLLTRAGQTRGRSCCGPRLAGRPLVLPSQGRSHTKVQQKSAVFMSVGGMEESKKQRRDPTAKRPNKLCDPYGQGGKSLSSPEVQQLLSTLHADWHVEEDAHQPTAIVRGFEHPDFLTGAKFAARIAAVAQMNAHYPTITLDRIIRRQQWHVVSTIRCQTRVLGGLSTHDFHLAMVREAFTLQHSLDSTLDRASRFIPQSLLIAQLIDVEADRPEVRSLVIDSEEIP